MTEPLTPADALALVARDRRIREAAEAWARVRRDPAATRAALRAAEDRLLAEVER
jgi:hypothetical protein